MLLSALLFLVALPTAFAPTPSHRQYYAMPASFLFLLVPYVFASNAKQARTPLLVLAAVALVWGLPTLLESTARLPRRTAWSALYAHDVSVRMREAVGANGEQGKVATLSPLFAAEANLPIYHELSIGPFLYRLGDLLTAEERRHFVATSPREIGKLLARDPPSAILVGDEGPLDTPLIEYAQSNGYERVGIEGFSGNLYVRSSKN
jgi:hypothetical protein